MEGRVLEREKHIFGHFGGSGARNRDRRKDPECSRGDLRVRVPFPPILMGNSAAKLFSCFQGGCRRATAAVTFAPEDFPVDSFFLHSVELTISGATISANPTTPLSTALSSFAAVADAFPRSPSFFSGRNLQCKRRKAGEDRVHVVLSKKPNFLFAGIYDGFNGPDATDYLLSHLFHSVQYELKGFFELDHDQVLKALSRALMKTEEAYLGVADKMVAENPELALMGSCVLVMVMKEEDVYFMNVGDSRAVLGQKILKCFESAGKEAGLAARQLTLDHSTCVEEEVLKIMKDHPDDASAIANHRVKGKLLVTRAFGAGFLKQPKWNNALLQRFKIEYIGTSPYITCSPSLCHLKLGPADAFLILSSDGLYQYFTNEEAVSEVEQFLRAKPDGDPAQHLVEEILTRAARRAGIEFHELLEIPQGDRRRYHDDVSVIVVFREGRVWKSGV